MNTHLVLLLAYSVGLVVLGAWVGRRVRGPRDFFVAGRALPAMLLFATMLAANIGAGSTVGAAGLGYRQGLSAWWWNGSAGIGSLLLALWIGPRIWQEAKRREYLTVGDFIEAHYGRSTRALTSALLWLGTLVILAAQLIGVASILHVVAGVRRPVGAALGGVVMVSYFVAGGLLSSAWVNLAQLIVLLAGFLVATPLAVAAAGGIGAIVDAPALPPGFFAFTGPDGSAVLLLALLGPAFMVSPGLLQKVFGAVDARAVRIGVAANAAALMCFGLLPPILGMVARVLHPTLASPDLALPTVLVHHLPPAVGSLALAAVFSAEVSSADAVLFMLSTSLSQDLYRRFLRPGATDQQVLSVARSAAIGGGIAGIGLAAIIPTVIGALSIFYGLLTVVVFVPIVAALHLRRAGPPEALASVLAGVTVLVATHLHTGGAALA
ncbi:MAG TPA: sodium:solute symporter family protein, partial [Vicinamibacterales bacterium]|nr:sodium:solute symporter family protein [Vicinamibacterales bacterium]